MEEPNTEEVKPRPTAWGATAELDQLEAFLEHLARVYGGYYKSLRASGINVQTANAMVFAAYLQAFRSH